MEEKPVPSVEIRIEDKTVTMETEEDVDEIQENGISEEEVTIETKPKQELKYKYKEGM